MSESADCHICGVCKQQFSSIELFFSHKQQKCSAAEEGDDLHSGLDSFGLEASDQHETSTLRARLLGLAAVAQAELLESAAQAREHSLRPFNISSGYSRGLQLDEEDVADVLANQLSGLGPPLEPVYEVSVNTEGGSPSEPAEPPQEGGEGARKEGEEEEPRKQSKKAQGKSKGKKDKESPLKVVFKCQESGCNFEGKYFKDLIRHTRIHTGEKPFECVICGRSFSRADKLKLHLRIHNGVKPFQCEQCSYASVDRSSLKKHKRTHTDERPCRCQLCPYRARDSSQLIVHLRTHTGDVPFVCLAPGCKAAFKTSSDLKRHTRLHTDEKPFACDVCAYRTRMKGNLLAHMRRAHLGGKKKFPCTQCSEFIAPTHSALQEHRKTHASVLLRCNVGKCSYVGMNIAAIRCHLRSKHPDECPLLACKHCSFACSIAGEMRSHMKEFHSDHEKRAKKRNATKASIKALKQSESSSVEHGKEVLNFMKTFKCPMCPVSYVREDSLRSHIRVHQRARNGQKGIVVVDTSMLNDQDPDDPEEVPPSQPAPPAARGGSSEPLRVSVLDPAATSAQQVVFYVPSSVNPGPSDPLMLSPNSGSSLLEQLSLQQGVQYILVPSSATEGFETQVETNNTFQQ